VNFEGHAFKRHSRVTHYTAFLVNEYWSMVCCQGLSTLSFLFVCQKDMQLVKKFC